MEYYEREYGFVPKWEEMSDGHRFTYRVPIPEPPQKRENILNYNLPQNEQVWRRFELPKRWDQLSEEAKELFISQDWKRRMDGVWIYINGRVTYLTGLNYFYLNWFYLDSGERPEYRDHHRRIFLFMKFMIIDDPDIYGMIYLKKRRDGATNIFLCRILEKMTRTRDAMAGIMSTTGPNAQAIFLRLGKSLNRLPKFYVPRRRGNKEAKNAIEFFPPDSRITMKNENDGDVFDEENALYSIINYRRTVPTAYDQEALTEYLHDEGGKVTECNVVDTWNISQRSLTAGIEIRGKAWWPSTAGEFDKRGGKNYKHLWVGASPEERDANGRTRNGLLRVFFPPWEGLEGFIGPFGESVITNATEEQVEYMKKKKPKLAKHFIVGRGAKDYLIAEREGKKDSPVDLAELKRVMPFNPEEALRPTVGDSIFDLGIIEETLYELDINPPVHRIVDLVRLYPDRLPHPIENPIQVRENRRNGKFYFSYIPPDEYLNKYSQQGSVFVPLSTQMERGSIGLDPFDHNKTYDPNTQEEKYSNAGMYGFLNFDRLLDDPHGDPMKWVSNNFVVEYLCRQPKAEMLNDDALNLCCFLGWQILIENNKVGTIRFFQQSGFGAFLMNRPEETVTKYSKGADSEPGVPTSNPMHDIYIKTFASYIYDHGRRCRFPRLLEQARDFDPSKFTKFDAIVGASLAIIASRKPVRTNIIPPDIKIVELYKQGPDGLYQRYGT